MSLKIVKNLDKIISKMTINKQSRSERKTNYIDMASKSFKNEKKVKIFINKFCNQIVLYIV